MAYSPQKAIHGSIYYVHQPHFLLKVLPPTAVHRAPRLSGWQSFLYCGSSGLKPRPTDSENKRTVVVLQEAKCCVRDEGPNWL